MTTRVMAGPGVSARGLTALFSADLISTAGTEMTAVALPWLVLVSTGSAARMGLVLAAEFSGITVLGLLGGRIGTLLAPRGTMLAADAARALLVAAIPVLDLLGALPLSIIVAVAFLLGGFFPAYSASQRLVLAQLTGEDELRLTRAAGLLNSVNESASLIGPAVGGLLVVVLGPRGVLALDAASYVCSFLLVSTLPSTPRAPFEPSSAGGGILEGLRYVLGPGALRRQVAGVALMQVGWTAMTATLRVVALHGGGAVVAGALLASYGLGSVIGGLALTRTRSVDGATARAATAGFAVTVGLLLLQPPLWIAMAVVAGNGVCAGLFFPRFFSALTARTPQALRTRVLTSVTIAIAAPAPLGFLAAGMLAQNAQSPIPGLVLATAAAGLGVVVVLLADVPGRRPADNPADNPAEVHVGN